MHFLAPSASKVSDQQITQKKLFNDALQLQKCWLRHWSKKVRQLFWKESNLNIETWYEYANDDIFASQGCATRNQNHQLSLPYVFTSIIKVDWYFDERNAATDHWERQVCFQEKLDNFWLYRSIKFAMQDYFPGTLSLRDLLQIKYWFRPWSKKSSCFKGIESVYQDNSYKHAKIDKFSEPGFRSEKQNIILDSWVAFYKRKFVDWDIDWKNLARGSGEKVRISRKINSVCSFWLNP